MGKFGELMAKKQQDSKLGMLCHLFAAIPFLWLVSVIIWLVKKNDDAGVEENGKNVLNVLIYSVPGVWLLFILMMVLSTPAPTISLLFFLLWLGVWVTYKVFHVIGIVKTNSEGSYEYPFWTHYPLIK